MPGTTLRPPADMNHKYSSRTKKDLDLSSGPNSGLRVPTPKDPQSHNKRVKLRNCEPISSKGNQRIEHTIAKKHRYHITFCKI